MQQYRGTLLIFIVSEPYMGGTHVLLSCPKCNLDTTLKKI